MDLLTIHKKIIDFLINFYIEHQENSSKDLFKLLMSDKEFVNENTFIENFLKWKEEALTPIHVLTSFNYSGITDTKRIAVINIYLRLFKLEGSVTINDFHSDNFVPTINKTKVLIGLNQDSQKEIWNFFFDAMQNNSVDIYAKNWYGLSTPVLSIFLYWIRPDKYVPLTKSIIRLYRTNDIEVPTDMKDYKNHIMYFKGETCTSILKKSLIKG